MRSFLKKVAVVAGVAALAALPALATSQAANLFGIQVQPFKAVPLQGVTTAVDTTPVLIIGYNGTTADPSVAVEADGNLTFLVGDAAYDGFECPVSGDLGGVIDVSDAACNTLGEVVDIINADQSDNSGFYAYIAAGLRSDSSNDTFLADADDTDVSRPQGEVIYQDTSAALTDQTLMKSQWLTAAEYLYDVLGGKQSINPENRRLISNPFAGQDTVLLYADSTVTNAGNIGDFTAYCVVEDYQSSGGSETATVMYSETGAASTALGQINEFLNAGGLRCRDGKVFIRTASDAASSAIDQQAYGFRFTR